MSDTLMRGVRVQLTTTMDSVLRTAVFEIMRIFESALYNHKMEMAEKGEQIAQLKTKLQTAELKLKDYEMRREETTETQLKAEVVPVAPEQPVAVPEIDVEVPDDWCAPLGCDASNKQEEGCPSEDNQVIDLQTSPVGRRSKRISAMNEKSNRSQDKSKPQAGQHPKISGDLNKLLQGLSKDYCNLTSLDRLRKKQTSGETFKDDDKKEKKGEEDSSKHKEKNKRAHKYTCETCYKVFYTKQSLGVHVRSQRKCKGCLKVLCFQSDVKHHKRACAEYKKLMKEKRRLKEKTPLQRTTLNSSKTEVTGEKEITQSSADKKKPSTRKFSCKQCSYKTNSRKKFRRHKMGHSEKTQASSICLERLDEEKGFDDVHKKKRKNLTQVSNQNGDLGWTEPLEDVDEDGGLKHGEKIDK